MRLRTLLDVVAVWGLRLAAVVFAPLLVFTARTWHGRAVGVLAAAIWTCVLSAVAGSVISDWMTPRYAFNGTAWTAVYPVPPFGLSRATLGYAVAGTLFLFFTGLLWPWVVVPFLLFTQANFRSDTPGLRSVFLGPLFLHRLQMVLMSEPDWLWLGTLIATRFDFRIRGDERRLIRDTVRHHLDELKESHESRVVPPALPLAVWGRVLNPDPGHLFAYRPEAGEGERLGLLVFLHGHGGNALLYPHLLRRLADDARCVLVCPSFGYGNWEHPHAAGCVERAVRYALEHFAEIDAGRTWLMGLSQGGAGVGRAAVALPDVFAGLVFVSPTMEPAVLNHDALTGRRVLVIHGDADRHVKLKHVEKGVDALRTAGADVTVCRDPTGTHFLLFAQPDEVFRQVAEWMTNEVAAPV